MLAIVEPARWEAVRAVCERWELPVAIIGRVTPEPEIVVLTDPTAPARSTPTGGPSRAPGSWPGSRPRPSPPARSSSSASPAPPTRRRAAPAPGAPLEPRRRAPAARPGPGRGPPGAAGLAQPLVAPQRCTSSTTPTSRRTRWPARDAVPPCCGSRARPRRWSPRPTGTRPWALLDPWLGAAMSVAEAARNVAITGARPLGVTNCLNFGDPTRPEAFWQLSEAVRGLSDACLALELPVTGGNVSLYNEAPGSAIAPTPEIGVVGLLEDVAKRVGPAFREDGNAVLLVGESRRRASRAASTRGSPGAAPEDGPPGARPGPRAPPPGVHPRGGRPRPASRAARTSRAAASPSRSPRWRSGAIAARSSGCTVGDSPAVELFGESPSRLDREVAPRHVPAFILLARQHGLPGRRARLHGRRAARHRARRRGRDRRRGGARQPDRRRARRRDRGPAARLGARPATGARLGGSADADVWRRRRRPARIAATRRPRSPRPACSRSSTAARSRPGSACRDGEHLMIYKDLGMVSQVLDERRIPSLRGDLAIAHCRYSTTGSTVWENAQPTFRLGPRRALAIGHNGNLVNTRELLGQLEGGRGRLPRQHRHGAPDRAPRRRAGGGHGRRPAPRPAPRARRVQPRGPRRAPGDRRPRPARLPAARARSAAADAATASTRPGLWARRHRPAGSSSSETAALDIVGAEYVRDVEPGEIVVLEPGREPRSVRYAAGDAGAVRVRADLLRPPRLVHGGPQPVRGRGGGWASSSRSSTRRTPTS